MKILVYTKTQLLKEKKNKLQTSVAKEQASRAALKKETVVVSRTTIMSADQLTVKDHDLKKLRYYKNSIDQKITVLPP